MNNENTANPMSRVTRRRLVRGQMAFPEKNFAGRTFFPETFSTGMGWHSFFNFFTLNINGL
jgi:hypothetical protein